MAWILTLTLVALAGIAVIVHLAAQTLIRPVKRALEERHEVVLAAPAEYGFEVEKLTAPTPDGGSLSALLFSPSPNPGAAEKMRAMQQRLVRVGYRPAAYTGRPRGVILMLHGRGGMKENAFPIVERFVAAGFRCISYDSRGYGESSFGWVTYGLKEADDVSAIIDALEARLGPDLGPVYLFGNSMGAAVTLQALPIEPRVSAAVTVSPFTSLDELTRHLAADHRFLRMDWMRRLALRYAGFRAGVDLLDVRPVDGAVLANVPVMVVHGDADTYIPPQHGKEIFSCLKHPDSRLRMVAGGTHFAVLATGGDDLYQDILQFFLASEQKLVAQPRASIHSNSRPAG